ncbi:uncharacterized protein LOC144294745 [Canis aureus]
MSSRIAHHTKKVPIFTAHSFRKLLTVQRPVSFAIQGRSWRAARWSPERSRPRRLERTATTASRAAEPPSRKPRGTGFHGPGAWGSRYTSSSTCKRRQAQKSERLPGSPGNACQVQDREAAAQAEATYCRRPDCRPRRAPLQLPAALGTADRELRPPGPSQADSILEMMGGIWDPSNPSRRWASRSDLAKLQKGPSLRSSPARPSYTFSFISQTH